VTPPRRLKKATVLTDPRYADRQCVFVCAFCIHSALAHSARETFLWIQILTADMKENSPISSSLQILALYLLSITMKLLNFRKISRSMRIAYNLRVRYVDILIQ
jgi:hypothetical protein